MPLPDAVRNVAELAGGKSVRIAGPEGEYRLLPKAAPDGDPSAAKVADLEMQLRAMMGVVASLAATVAAISTKVDGVPAAVAALEATAKSINASQGEIKDGLCNLTRTLAMPTQPIYDAKGMLIGARRVAEL